MRSIIAVLAFILLKGSAFGQDPVHWKFTAKKMAGMQYEIHCTAAISGSWHIYSQTTPEGGPVPTSFTFVNNAMLNREGLVKENGKMTTRREEVFGINVKYFEGQVDFVQTVTLKAKIKTNISGTVSYMVCNDSQCLPPRSVAFNIALK